MDDILQIIDEETNKYATQWINNSACSSKSHQRAWKPITKAEINTFIDILLIMGIVQVSEIRLYWSQNDMYTNARIKNAMKRDRFLSILKYLYFSDNTTAITKYQLHKIRNIVEAKWAVHSPWRKVSRPPWCSKGYDIFDTWTHRMPATPERFTWNCSRGYVIMSLHGTRARSLKS